MNFPFFPIASLLALLCSGPLPGQAADAPENSGSAPVLLPPLEQLFGSPRASGHDLLLLHNGTELRGTIANSRIQIHSSLGSLAVDSALIAGIQFDATPAHLDLLILANRNRLTGFINESIELQTPTGLTNCPKHAIQHILFAFRGPERHQPLPCQFVILNSGDILSGAFTLPPIAAQSPSGTRLVASEDIQVIRAAKSGTFLLQLRDGREQVARLETPARLTLPFGPELLLPPARWKVIYNHALFLPPELELAFGAIPDPLASLQPPEGFSPPPGMVWIPPGKFIMGSSLGEIERGADEDPQTEVTITRGFWMGRHEVTQHEYFALIGTNPSNFQGDTNRPVEKVNWHEAREYCSRLTAQARAQGTLPPGYIYRLPTEAEWEYACRAGTSTRFSHGDDPTTAALRNYAWFIGNSDSSSHPVGQLQPNPWGLHDMHGNVWEWCLDIWGASYPGGSIPDYTGPAEGWLRVARGGSWLYDPAFSRSANRDDYGPENRCSDIGFRVVLAHEL